MVFMRIFKTVDRLLKKSYSIYSPERIWALTRLWAGIAEKFSVGCFLVGIFQNKNEGIYWGIAGVVFCSLITYIDESKRSKK